MRDKRIHILMDEGELKALDTWRFAHEIASRGEAVRMLVYAGVAVSAPGVAARIMAEVVAPSRPNDPCAAAALAQRERCAHVVDAKLGELTPSRDRMLIALLQDISRDIRGLS